ncbi:MAG TPA: alginate export family protein [Bryobacteraceae bacterium]|nr:alginate export family protein [Bryobacteraceae bacterium]
MHIFSAARIIPAIAGTALYISIFPSSVTAQNSDATKPGTSVSANANSEEPRHLLPKSITLSGQIRERWESYQGPSSFVSTTANSYVASRIRLGVAYKPLSWLRFFGETQDSRVLFYKVKPSGSVSDPFDWRQGYVEVGALEGNGVSARVGRQEIHIGSERLLTSGDFSNVTKPFNMALGTITYGSFSTQLLAGSIILVDPAREDRSRPGEHVYGDYSTFKKLIPGASVEPYVFVKTALNVKSKDGAVGNADIVYAGGRVIGKIRKDFDYSVEAVREAGSYANDSMEAWGYIAGGGWTNARLPWKLHFSTEYAFASGDSGAKDGRHESFDILYGAQQPPTSLTGMFCWRNIEDLRVGGDFSPWKKLLFKVAYRDYWLATIKDGLYNAANGQVVLNRKATSNHVGDGVDAQAVVAVNGKTSVGFGLGTLNPGEYLIQSKKTSEYYYPFVFLTRKL